MMIDEVIVDYDFLSSFLCICSERCLLSLLEFFHYSLLLGGNRMHRSIEESTAHLRWSVVLY